MIINWIKCSEQMSPDDMKIIIKPIHIEPFCEVGLNLETMPNALTKMIHKYWEWTPYTPETWDEVNK